MASSLSAQLSLKSRPNVNAVDANATLTKDSNRHQVLTGLSVTRDLNLPTTGIAAGEVFLIENTTAFDLVIKASGGNALTIANSANIDATIRKGNVLLRALQATPTTPAHWFVIDVIEEGTFTADFNQGVGAGGSNTSKTIAYRRSKKFVTLDLPDCLIATGGTPNRGIDTASGTVPLRLRTASGTAHGVYNAIINAANVAASGRVDFNNDGSIQIMRDGTTTTNWPTASSPNGLQQQSFSWFSA